MAAVEATAAVEDDEEWLYGGSENTDQKPEDDSGQTSKTDKEEGEMSGEEAASQSVNKGDDSDEDSDDDDDVQVTIGDIKAFPLNDASGPRVFQGSGPYKKPTAAAGSGQTATTGPTSSSNKGVDIEAEGEINGVGVMEFNLDSLQEEEKPWKKPGADITDYFNYGFTEETWRMYCHKQNRLRGENGAVMSRPFILHSSPMPAQSLNNTVGRTIETTSKTDALQPPGTQNNLGPLKILTQKTTPTHVQQPQRKVSGTIDVIGSTARDSRRPQEDETQPISVAAPTGISQELAKHFTSVPPPALPPPGLPPNLGMPPLDYSMPPPGMGLPPPGLHPAAPPPGLAVPGVPPPIFHPPPDLNPFFQPPTGPPPPDPRSFTDRPPPFSFDTTHTTQTSSSFPPESAQYRDQGYPPQWDFKRERSPAARSDGSGSESERYRDRDRESSSRREFYESRDFYRSDRDSRRERSRSREKDRGDRDRERRHRDRERSDRERSERDRSDRDRGDRERSERSDRDRDRDDKHKSRSRKIKIEPPDDPEYHKSSKHKKSKRSKRDKEEEGSVQSQEESSKA